MFGLVKLSGLLEKICVRGRWKFSPEFVRDFLPDSVCASEGSDSES